GAYGPDSRGNRGDTSWARPGAAEHHGTLPDRACIRPRRVARLRAPVRPSDTRDFIAAGAHWRGCIRARAERRSTHRRALDATVGSDTGECMDALDRAEPRVQRLG